MTLGEARLLLKKQLGYEWSGSPLDLDLALGWGRQQLLAEAVACRSKRLVHPIPISLIADEDEYLLDQSIYSVVGVERLDMSSTPVPLTPASFTQRSHADEPEFMSDLIVYWLTHRTLHIRPIPTTAEDNGLRVWSYVMPPLPTIEDDEVLVPPEAVRYWILISAMMTLPPPAESVGTMLNMALPLAKAQYNRWLKDAVTDVAPGLTVGSLPV